MDEQDKLSEKIRVSSLMGEIFDDKEKIAFMKPLLNSSGVEDIFDWLIDDGITLNGVIREREKYQERRREYIDRELRKRGLIEEQK